MGALGRALAILTLSAASCGEALTTPANRVDPVASPPGEATPAKSIDPVASPPNEGTPTNHRGPVASPANEGTPPNSVAPVASPPGEGMQRSDLDGDGRDDCWQRGHDGGSGFGGPHLSLRLGCDGEALGIDAYGSFGEFLSAARLPAAIVAHPRAIEGVRRELFGEAASVCEDARCPGPDGSFAWLLDELAARARPPTSRGPFADVWRYTPRWEPGAPTIPTRQVITLSRREYAEGVRSLDPGEPAPIDPGDQPYALIAYSAHNHQAGGRTLERAAECGSSTAWTTAHGVAIEDRAAGRWSWVYVSTGVDKLRWPSLERVVCAGSVVAIERRGAGRVRELIVVDTSSGGVGERVLADGETWVLAGEVLRIGGEAWGVGDALGRTVETAEHKTKP